MRSARLIARFTPIHALTDCWRPLAHRCLIIELIIPAGQHGWKGALAPPPQLQKLAASPADFAQVRDLEQVPAPARSLKAASQLAVGKVSGLARSGGPPPPSGTSTRAHIKVSVLPDNFSVAELAPTAWQQVRHQMHTLGLQFHAWSQQLVEGAAKCIVPPAGSAGEPHFYVTAWEGPRAGECNEEPIALSQLRALLAAGAIPREVLVWPVHEGTAWRKAGDVVDALERTVEGAELYR